MLLLTRVQLVYSIYQSFGLASDQTVDYVNIRDIEKFINTEDPSIC